ncbi:MAG: protein-glutamate O-methyltransferase [Deltaproteobacteria bacterium]|nr:protein-glutamate O-methyltransferase [Deltaproteobacteria bacterium]
MTSILENKYAAKPQDSRKEPPETSVDISEKDFRRLSEFIYDQCGIKLPPSKKTMLQARLQRRLRTLSLRSYGEYCDYLFTTEGMQEELTLMIDLVTTNKTDFFREPAHFDYLVENCLPGLADPDGLGYRKKVAVWSAGCSTGEEPYTLAMVLSDFVETNPGFQFSVLATDISTRVLRTAAMGIYESDKVDPVPIAMKRKYLLRNKDRSKDLVRVVPGLRARVSFRQLNFMESDFGIGEPLDVIFCRNVIIYFDKPTQEKLLNRFCRHLAPGGYVFLGHSETIFGMDLPLVQVAPTVYRKP